MASNIGATFVSFHFHQKPHPKGLVGATGTLLLWGTGPRFLLLEGETGHSGELVRSTATAMLLVVGPFAVCFTDTETDETEVAIVDAVDILCDRFVLFVSWSLSSLLLSCSPRNASLLKNVLFVLLGAAVVVLALEFSFSRDNAKFFEKALDFVMFLT